MSDDFKQIKTMIKKNEHFYENGLIDNAEYSENCLLFAHKIDSLIDENQRISIKKFLTDEFNLVKFRFSVAMLKAIPN